MPKIFTEHGYPLGDVISTIQKEIRRGEERSAMFWAYHLIPRYEMYLWRRLMVIANEDIGLGNPQVLYVVPSLRDQFFEFRAEGKNGTCRLILANALALMCRSPKSRLADHLQRAVSQEFMDQPEREFPDYALDKHTERLQDRWGRWLGVEEAKSTIKIKVKVRRRQTGRGQVSV